MNITETVALIKGIINDTQWIHVFGVVGFLTVFTFMMVGQFTSGDGFDFRDLVAKRLPEIKGKIQWKLETDKVYKTTAWLVMTWGFVWLVVSDNLSELYLTIYAVAWIGNTAVDRLSAAKAGAIVASPEQPSDVTMGDVKVQVNVPPRKGKTKE